MLETVLLNPPAKLALRINHELIIVEPLLPLKFDPAQPSQEEEEDLLVGELGTAFEPAEAAPQEEEDEVCEEGLEEGEEGFDVLLAQILTQFGVFLCQLHFAIELLNLQLQPHRNHSILKSHMLSYRPVAAALVLHSWIHYSNRVLLVQIVILLVCIQHVILQGFEVELGKELDGCAAAMAELLQNSDCVSF